MSESVDRELGKLSQQIENTAKNLGDVRSDLTRLFDVVDYDSKGIVKEIAVYEIQQKETIRRFDDLKKDVTDSKKAISKEREERLTFETETKAGVKFTKYAALILGTLATLISATAAIFALLN